MIHFPSLIGVVAASVIAFGIGGLWFSPALFGNDWLKELHVGDRPVSRSTGALLAIPAAVGSALILGILIESIGSATPLKGVCIGFLIWLGFAVAIHLPAIYLEHAPRRFLIDAGHKLVVFVAMGAALGAWG